MSTMFLISELAARSGFTPSALRYYEQVGLLSTAERSPGGYRLYDEQALARLRFIHRAKQLGLPLEEIRELVAVWDGGLCSHVQDRLRSHITAKSAEVRARIDELSTFAAQLDEAHAALGAPAPAGPCGDGCGCADSDPGGASAPQVLDLTPTRRLSTADVIPDATPEVQAATGAHVPVACTLTATDQPGRLTAWTDLLRTVEGRDPIEGGLRLRFPADPTLAGRLGELAAREQSCCAFFTFTLQLGGDALTLDVQAPSDAAEVLADMFGTS